MNKYDRLMQEIIDYLDGTWLSRARHLALSDRGSIAGGSVDEIEQVEAEIGKKLPLALKAWYRVAGKVPPYLYDEDADYSLRDLRRAQETARELTLEETCEWELTASMIPFSQRGYVQFLFVKIEEENPDDPPVFHYLEGNSQPRQTAIAFTISIREMWLGWLDFPAWDKENSNEIKSWREKGYENWLPRKHVVGKLRSEIATFRRQLIDRIHQEYLKTDKITGPREFQELWIEEFSASDVWQKVQSEGLRFPYNWVTAPAK